MPTNSDASRGLSTLRAWGTEDLTSLLAQAATYEAEDREGTTIFDVQDPRFLPPGDVRRVHVVGGGAQNALLCQLLADRLSLPVLAGPVEATALGNVLVQGRAHGALSGSLEDLRALVARTQPPLQYLPTARGAVR